MGLLSNVVTKIKSSPVGKVLDTLTVAIAHPVKTIEAIVSPKITINDVIKEHFEQPLGEQLLDTAIGTASIAGVITGAGAVANVAKTAATTGVKTLGSRLAELEAKKIAQTALKTVTSLIPTTPLGKVGAALAIPVVAGAVINQPKKAAELVVKTPFELANFGGNVANFIAEPNLENAKTIASENPLITGAAAAGAALLVGSGVANLTSNILNRQEMKKQTEAFERQAEAAEQLLKTPPTENKTIENKPISSSVPITPQTPITPETKPLIATAGSGSRSVSRRKKYKRITSVMRQNVNVLVSNRNIGNTKRYLNTISLRN